MTPEFHRELLALDERDAGHALRVALTRIGTPADGGPAKARALQRLLSDFLATGYPAQDGVGQVLREIRNDIDLRLQILENAGVTS